MVLLSFLDRPTFGPLDTVNVNMVDRTGRRLCELTDEWTHAGVYALQVRLGPFVIKQIRGLDWG